MKFLFKPLNDPGDREMRWFMPENPNFRDLTSVSFRNTLIQKSAQVTDERKERIPFNTEMIKFLMLVFLASGGGVISLLLKGVDFGREGIILAGGMIVALISGILTLIVYKNTSKLIE